MAKKRSRCPARVGKPGFGPRPTDVARLGRREGRCLEEERRRRAGSACSLLIQHADERRRSRVVPVGELPVCPASFVVLATLTRPCRLPPLSLLRAQNPRADHSIGTPLRRNSVGSRFRAWRLRKTARCPGSGRRPLRRIPSGNFFVASRPSRCLGHCFVGLVSRTPNPERKTVGQVTKLTECQGGRFELRKSALAANARRENRQPSLGPAPEAAHVVAERPFHSENAGPTPSRRLGRARRVPHGSRSACVG